MTFVLLGAALLATLAAAYCAYADGALLSVDEDDPPSSAAVAGFVARRERTHRALAFARIVTQLLAGASTVAALEASGIAPIQVGPLVLVAGVLTVVLAESVARTGGAASGARGVERCAAGIRTVERVMTPVTALGASADAWIGGLLPPPPDPDAQREQTVEQYHEVVAAEADVSADDELLLRGAFSLGDTTAQDIMVPRVDVVGMDRGEVWPQVVRLVRETHHTRYPVFEGSLDNVIGVLHAKDMLPSVLSRAAPEGGWGTLVRPAQFIPGTKPVDELMRELKTTRQHMAIVVDEFGGTAGVVTMEDVLEVIVGEIHDEHDEEEPDVRVVANGVYSLSARLPLDDVNELTGSEFERQGVHTIGGLVLAVIGAVPRQGEVIVSGNFRLVVERVVRRRIVRVIVERLVPA